MIRLAHLSDLHATPVALRGVAPLLGKRFFGWLSWRMRRRHGHLPRVLDALVSDLHAQAPDQVVVTGDLTNLSLESEFGAARALLRKIGSPSRVSLVPGNHDAYVRVPAARSWDAWLDYWASDPRAAEVEVAPDAKPDPRHAFPTLRLRDGLALIGLCSAIPTVPLRASGALGPAQLERLERLLAELAGASACRVVLIHHPPVPGAVSRRRALVDAGALGAVLRRFGADLVLHGHTHRTHVATLPGPQHPIPVIGVRSASDVGSRPGRRAQYHVYEISSGDPAAAGPRFRIRMRTRGYDPASGGVLPEREQLL